MGRKIRAIESPRVMGGPCDKTAQLPPAVILRCYFRGFLLDYP